MSTNRSASRGTPNHLDLYLIIIGVAAGISLGPYVLGRVSSRTYDRIFVVGTTGLQQLSQLDDHALDRRSHFPEGITEIAIQEYLDKEHAGRQERRLDMRATHFDRLRSILTTLVLAIMAIMILETLVTPGAVPSRLTAARYALIAVWLAIVLAQPRLLQVASVTFVSLLVVVVALATFLPLRKRLQ